ncbi:MAG: COX15/CtaA family protein [Chitinophagaceae bacterium]|nr:COX15/CtaA family protein [Chitinophagaceae bacterium]
MKFFIARSSSRPIAIWLLIGVGMIMIQVMLGGITRLTGSGLSITEWKPILGTLPPTDDASWQAAFEKYKQIGQYKQINFTYTLEDFKFIYFWEWLHRNWARLLGVVFLIPFIVFLIQKRFRRDMILPMVILFILGALQGAIGWIMVQSGLNQNDVYVSHIRLAGHFIGALVLLCYALWFALKLLVPSAEWVINRSFRNFTIAILVVYTLQLIYGAFMAGLKAAVAAPTWPTINGKWLPAIDTGNLTGDLITVQFIHRGLAYLITLLVLIWWVKARQIVSSAYFSKTRALPLVVVVMQVALGVLTVLYSSDRNILLWLGAAHQFTAMILLMLWIWMIFLLRSKSFLRLS